jgi:hypothetical protein
MDTRYAPVDDGYRIVGSLETFNRTLYGGHGQDALPERYFTAAGDAPIAMGAVSDWRQHEDCSHAKCGTLMAGVAVTPGYHLPVFYYHGERDGDRTAEWFHQSPGTVSTFRPGWMEYEVRPFFQCYPVVTARLEVMPLQSDDGFLVGLEVHADQRELLVIGFGGVTDFLGNLTCPFTEARAFRSADCAGNEVRLTGGNTALVRGAPQLSCPSQMRLGASFPVDVSIGDAKESLRPGRFAGPVVGVPEHPMVRMTCAIGAGQTLRGFVVALRNATEERLAAWLVRPDAVSELRRELETKARALELRTPDPMLNLTAAPNVLAMDACWHHDAFCHGAHSWHCPYMGWRNWYGPTVLGWHDRVQTAFRTHARHQVKPDPASGPEEVVYEGAGPCHRLRHSHGYIPEIPDGRTGIFYNMQEVGVDMALHGMEWSGDLAYGAEVFDAVAAVLDWEERLLDPDGDGLYQNWLNTWISDAHAYNGGGCAQASAYNYRANRLMAILADRLGRDSALFRARAARTHAACHGALWLADRGVLAEYVDTVGHRLVHPSPELATVYHAIEADLVDPFQAYQMLRFTETDLRNARTLARGGRLAWSSNWYPQNYSSCGLYPAENLHLAWAYYQCGQAERGNDLLRGITDAHFLSRYPGVVAHCMTESGFSEGSADFSEISSLHLRVLVEGLFGVRFHLLDGWIRVAPNFPPDWEDAQLRTAAVAVRYQRTGREETLVVRAGAAARRQVHLRLRGTRIESAWVNGRPATYRIEPGIGRATCVIETDEPEAEVRVVHGPEPPPSLAWPAPVAVGDGITMEVSGGAVEAVLDPSACLEACHHAARRVQGTARGRPGSHVVFVRASCEQWQGWLPADLVFAARHTARRPGAGANPRWDPVPIEALLNVNLTEVHNQEYRRPRPSGYSIMASLNGRFGWDWNQAGFGKVEVDDTALRGAGGEYRVDSGIPFRTPGAGPNAACVSVWENFPDQLHLPLRGHARELAALLVGVTNPMQARVENARFVVAYRDGGQEELSLVNPENFDDWLVAAVQTEFETVYFSDRNHALVARLALDPDRELGSLTLRAVANEVIVGVLGVSLAR